MLLFGEVPCQGFFLNRLLKYYIVILLEKDPFIHILICLGCRKMNSISCHAVDVYCSLTWPSTQPQTPHAHQVTVIQAYKLVTIQVWLCGLFCVYLSQSCRSLLSRTAKVLPYHQKVCVCVRL